jgi:hypothetical protein
MGGRDLNPGEELDPYFGLRDNNYFNRLVRGQIGSVDNINGKVQVDFVEIIGTRPHTVPTLWFSATSRTSAWGRYMPMGGEIVHVGQRNDGTSVIVNYDATATKDGSPGWEEIATAQQEGKTPGFQTWRELKRGEYDFKSSGDAYIHGSNAGVLSLYGGQAYIKLEKEAYRLSSKAATYRYIAGACQIKFGAVYRKETIASSDETPVQPGTFQEFLVDINQILPTGTSSPQSKAKLHFGDILQATTNVPEISTDTGAPLRGRITIGDALNAAQVFKLEIDQLGNVVWNQGATGTLGLKMRAGMFNLEATLDARFNGTTITLGKVGASEPLVCGNLLINALTQLINTVFIANTAAWGIGNLGAPVPLSPAVVTALNTWLSSFVSNQFFNSTKAFTEKA